MGLPVEENLAISNNLKRQILFDLAILPVGIYPTHKWFMGKAIHWRINLNSKIFFKIWMSINRRLLTWIMVHGTSIQGYNMQMEKITGYIFK